MVGVVVGKYRNPLTMQTVKFLEYSVFQSIRRPCQYLIKSRYVNVGAVEVVTAFLRLYPYLKLFELLSIDGCGCCCSRARTTSRQFGVLRAASALI